MSRITRNTNSSIDEPEISLSNQQNENEHSNLNTNEKNITQQQNVSDNTTVILRKISDVIGVILTICLVCCCLFLTNQFVIAIIMIIICLKNPVFSAVFFQHIWTYTKQKNICRFLRIFSLCLMIFCAVKEVVLYLMSLNIFKQSSEVTNIVQDFVNKTQN